MDHRLAAGRSQPVAIGRRATILPHDRAMNRLAAGAIPNDDRFALIRDTDRRDVCRLQPRFRKYLARHVALARPDFLGIVFDPTRLRKVLAELALGDARRFRPSYRR